MEHHQEWTFRDPDVMPTREMIAPILGRSYAAYEAFQDALPALEIEQEWQWYTPYKAWLAKGQHFWTTKRGTKKEKTLYWLYIYEGFFCVVICFKEKNRAALLSAEVSETAKQLIDEANTMGKLPTFPIPFEVTAEEALADIYTLIDCKKELER